MFQSVEEAPVANAAVQATWRGSQRVAIPSDRRHLDQEIPAALHRLPLCGRRGNACRKKLATTIKPHDYERI
eukprot:2211745-Prymnesium_polylepis.4